MVQIYEIKWRRWLNEKQRVNKIKLQRMETFPWDGGVLLSLPSRSKGVEVILKKGLKRGTQA